MKDLTEQNFGLLIAFWLPGFLVLWGLSYSSSLVTSWFSQATPSLEGSIGAFLFSSLASLSIGMVISAVRWLIVDHLLARTGVGSPPSDMSKLKDKDTFAAFQGVVANHYRYYQFYSNSLIAIMAALFCAIHYGDQCFDVLTWVLIAFVLVALLLASRDALKKYNVRSSAILQ